MVWTQIEYSNYSKICKIIRVTVDEGNYKKYSPKTSDKEPDSVVPV